MKRNLNIQSGIILLEALIGIVIFSIGILAMIALQARAIAVQSDAQNRIEAAKRVDQLIGQITTSVDRTSSTTMNTALDTYQHQPGGATATCSYSGAASAAPIVTNWITAVTTTPQTKMAGTTAEMVQILIDTSTGAFNIVTVTLCWQAPNSPTPNRHTVVAYIN